MEVQLGDQAYNDRRPRRVQRPDSENTDPLTGYNEFLEETAFERVP